MMSIKVKPLRALLIGAIVVLLGALLKIQKFDVANYFLVTGMLIEIATIVYIFKNYTLPRKVSKQ